MIAVLCLITLPSTKKHTLAGGAQVRWSSLKMDVVGGIKKKITSWCWIYDRLFRSSSAMWDLDPTGFKPWLWAPYRLLLPFPFKVSTLIFASTCFISTVAGSFSPKDSQADKNSTVLLPAASALWAYHEVSVCRILFIETLSRIEYVLWMPLINHHSQERQTGHESILCTHTPTTRLSISFQ